MSGLADVPHLGICCERSPWRRPFYSHLLRAFRCGMLALSYRPERLSDETAGVHCGCCWNGNRHAPDSAGAISLMRVPTLGCPTRQLDPRSEDAGSASAHRGGVTHQLIHELSGLLGTGRPTIRLSAACA